MKIKPEQLSTALKNTLDPLYFVFGAERLLVEQSLSEIKTTAKQYGFDERISFEIDGNFDWQKITAEIAAVSLFSPKRIIDCRLKTGKIGVKGSKALTELAKTLPNDILLLISTDKLDANQQKSKWFKTLEQHGNVIQHWEIQTHQLAGWISNHMATLGLETNPDVAQSIAFCTEGNLLASMQEIQKLKLAYPDGKIDAAAYQTQLNQQSKYSIYGLIDAALAGNGNQVLKIFDILQDEAALPIKLSFALQREINTLIGMSIELQQVKQIDTVLQNHRVWNKRKPIISSVLKRLPYPHLQKLLLLLGRIDRSIKGMDNLNVINACRTLLLNLAGKNHGLNH